jgi:hypothetical protein
LVGFPVAIVAALVLINACSDDNGTTPVCDPVDECLTQAGEAGADDDGGSAHAATDGGGDADAAHE